MVRIRYQAAALDVLCTDDEQKDRLALSSDTANELPHCTTTELRLPLGAPAAPSLAPQARAINARILTILPMSSGYCHACALLSDGSVECWGDNEEGQLGDGLGPKGSSLTPVSVKW